MKVVQTDEPAAFAIQVAVDVALGYPRVGTHIGGGIHVNMPPTWDGQGATPPGWEKHGVTVWSKGTLDAWVELEDGHVAAVASSGLLTGPQKATVAAAAVLRVPVPDPTEADTRFPKADAVAVQVGTATALE